MLTSHSIPFRTAEVTSGIIASCLPTLPSFFRYFFQKAVTRFSFASAGGSKRRRRVSGLINKEPPAKEEDPGKQQPQSQQELQHPQILPKKRSRLGLGTKDSEIMKHSYWELEDNEQHEPAVGQIFQGRCYTTTEAKASIITSESESLDNSIDGEKSHPFQGILKTIEVNIKSTPRERREQHVPSEGQNQNQNHGEGQ